MKIKTSGLSFDSVRALANDVAAAFNIIQKTWGAEHRAEGGHLFPWVDLPYRATRFVGAGMTWGVDNTDVQTLQYLQIDKAIWLQWMIASSDCGGGAAELRIELPTVPALYRSHGSHWYQDAGGTGALGRALVLPGENFVRIQKADVGNWTATTSDNTRTEGSILYRIP